MHRSHDQLIYFLFRRNPGGNHDEFLSIVADVTWPIFRRHPSLTSQIRQRLVQETLLEIFSGPDWEGRDPLSTFVMSVACDVVRRTDGGER